MSWFRLAVALAGRCVIHPTLAIDLLRVNWRFRHRYWYRRPPFLPLPDPQYVRWRMDTAYGDRRAVPSAHDVERYARWVSTGR